MEYKKINESLSVSGQINSDDIASLKSTGIKTIICNRPDNEDPGQPDNTAIKKICEDNGLQFYFMPVVSGNVTTNDGDNFSKILKEAPQPIHAYCRSGMRCTTLWALTELKNGTDKEAVMAQAAQAGYDLSKSL